MSSKFKTVKRFHHPGDCHELAFCYYRRLPLLTNNPWRNRLAEQLDRANAIHHCRLVAYVFMPEHVHILVQPAIVSFRIDRFLHSEREMGTGSRPDTNPLRRQSQPPPAGCLSPFPSIASRASCDSKSASEPPHHSRTTGHQSVSNWAGRGRLPSQPLSGEARGGRDG
jgi:Transposase IS200 like